MKIEILCTGDEVLSGKTVNTNYSHIARRLTEHGFETAWGTTVGDHHGNLIKALTLAGQRADAVIVNGGLGPTVDDLSQQVAAEAAGVELVLHEPWLERMRKWYESNGRVMPANNTKQAMLPSGAEFIDNPVGTACGFAITIGHARCFFTPGVPHELKRMLDDEILPRLEGLRKTPLTSRVKRFHTFGLGESRADRLLDGIENLDPTGSTKLGFQSHYPQLETKLTVLGKSATAVSECLAPVEAEVRSRIGDYILCEDDERVESVILNALQDSTSSLSILESGTRGAVANRLLSEVSGTSCIHRGLIALNPEDLNNAAGLDADGLDADSDNYPESIAKAFLAHSRSTHALLVLMREVTLNDERTAASVNIVVATENNIEKRDAILPGRSGWTSRGTTELAIDCLRRVLTGQPIYQKIDFEQH